MIPSIRFSGWLAATAVLAAPALAWADYGDGQHMMWGGGMGGLFGIVMMLIMVALIAAVVALIWRAINPGKSQTTSDDSALGILKERYARGEIDKQEYEERRRILKA